MRNEDDSTADDQANLLETGQRPLISHAQRARIQSYLPSSEQNQVSTGVTVFCWLTGVVTGVIAFFVFSVGLWSGALIVALTGSGGSRLARIITRRVKILNSLLRIIGQRVQNNRLLEAIAIRYMHVFLTPTAHRNPRNIHEALVRAQQQDAGVHTISFLAGLIFGGVSFFSGGLISGILMSALIFSLTEGIGTAYINFLRFAARINAEADLELMATANHNIRDTEIAVRSIAPQTLGCFYLASAGAIGKLFVPVIASIPLLIVGRGLPPAARAVAGAATIDALHDLTVAAVSLSHGVMPENIPDIVRARSLKYKLLKSLIYAFLFTLLTLAITLGAVFSYRVKMSAVTGTSIAMAIVGIFVFWAIFSYIFMIKLDNLFMRVFHRFANHVGLIPFVARRRNARARLLVHQFMRQNRDPSMLGNSAAALATAIIANHSMAAMQLPEEGNSIQQREQQWMSTEGADRAQLIQTIEDRLREVGQDGELTYYQIDFNQAGGSVTHDMLEEYRNQYFVIDLHRRVVNITDTLPSTIITHRIVDITDQPSPNSSPLRKRMPKSNLPHSKGEEENKGECLLPKAVHFNPVVECYGESSSCGSSAPSAPPSSPVCSLAGSDISEDSTPSTPVNTPSNFEESRTEETQTDSSSSASDSQPQQKQKERCHSSDVQTTSEAAEESGGPLVLWMPDFTGTQQSSTNAAYKIALQANASPQIELQLPQLYDLRYLMPKKYYKHFSDSYLLPEDFQWRDEGDLENFSSSVQSARVKTNDAEEEDEDEDAAEEKAAEEMLNAKQSSRIGVEGAKHDYNINSPQFFDKLPEREDLPTSINFGGFNFGIFSGFDSITLLGILTLTSKALHH